MNLHPVSAAARARVLRGILPILLGSLPFAPPASAQPPGTEPAFSLYSSHVATTRERPVVELMFRQVTSLDFRVYRVQDPVPFFSRLREPHQLGSEAPAVPQEQTILERIARWKAARRDAIRSFFRAQFSHDYRAARREAAAKKAIALRRPIQYNRFAQVPLLNGSGCCPPCGIPRSAAFRSSFPAPASTWWRRCTRR
jgi:hypothetical protein